MQADREGQIARPYSVCGRLMPCKIYVSSVLSLSSAETMGIALCRMNSGGHLGLADAGEDNETKEWDAAGIPQNKRIHHTMPRKLN